MADDMTPETEALVAQGGDDAEKAKRIKDAIARFKESTGVTPSGSEAPADAPVEKSTPEMLEGKNVDWSEYDLDFSVKHLYEKAQYRMTPQGPKWVARIEEFYSTEKSYRNHDKVVNTPGSDEKEFLNLAQYLNDMLNRPEEWVVVSILPASQGQAGVLLRRAVPVALPEPVLLKKSTEVEAPGDPELSKLNDTALAFIAGEMEQKRPMLEQLALELNGPAVRDPLGSMTDGCFPTVTHEDPAAVEAAIEAERALALDDFGTVADSYEPLPDNLSLGDVLEP